jgi:predicted patatin/cPLA2 family phospholipase
VPDLVRTRARAGSRPGRRDDDARLALVVEGGGMRGTVSGGMALAVHELGLLDAVDAVYGSSAGAISGAWLLSSDPEGLRGWIVPEYARTLIRRSNALRGRPVVDLRGLVEGLYRTDFPMDFASVRRSPVEFHPPATDAATGVSTDLRPLITDDPALRLALRASAALPVLAGGPVALGGRLFYDAGLSESVPFRTALAQGATHVLVLRSRRAEDVPRPSRSAALVARTALRRESAALRRVFTGRTACQLRDEEHLAGHPAILSVRPADGSPAVGRLTRDETLLAAALEAGRAAVRAAFGTPPGPA